MPNVTFPWLSCQAILPNVTFFQDSACSNMFDIMNCCVLFFTQENAFNFIQLIHTIDLFNASDSALNTTTRLLYNKEQFLKFHKKNHFFSKKSHFLFLFFYFGKIYWQFPWQNILPNGTFPCQLASLV